MQLGYMLFANVPMNEPFIILVKNHDALYSSRVHIKWNEQGLRE